MTLRRLTLITALGAVVFLLFGLFAQLSDATTDNCTRYRNHTGQIPASYDYGYGEEYDNSYRPKLIDTFRVNGGENAGEPSNGGTWDYVWKCKVPPTTTTTVTSTTSPPSTTIPPTTTTIVDTTTTVPSTTTTSSTTSTTTTTEPPTTSTTTITPTTSVPPTTTSSTVPPTTPTTAPPSTPTTTVPELPMTGPGETLLALFLIGSALCILGAAALYRARTEADE